MSELEILNQFKKSLISFLDEIISQFPTEEDIVFFRIVVNDKIPEISLMNEFILKILPHKDMITNRNEDFFINYNSEEIKNSSYHLKFENIKSIWRSPYLDKYDKDIIWQWFNTFVIISESYQNALLTNIN